MNIGIFLGFGPQVKLKREGLGRYVGDLIQGLLSQGHEVTVACPHWLHDSLDGLLDDYGMDDTCISILMTQDNPVLWNIYDAICGKRKMGLLSKIVRLLNGWMMRWNNRQWKSLVGTHSRLGFALWLVLDLPLMALLAAAYVLLVLCRWLAPYAKNIFMLRWQKNKTHAGNGADAIRQVIRQVVCMFREHRQYLSVLSYHEKQDALFLYHQYQDFMAQYGKKGVWFLSLFQQMNEYERKRLVDLVNRRGGCDVWFVPGLFWPEAEGITQATVVYNAPDLTTSVFAESFAGTVNRVYATGKCRETLENGTYFITYCGYIKKMLMEREYMKASWQMKAIPHSNHDLLPYIHIDDALAKQNCTTKDYTKAFAWSLLGMEHVRFLFYASQPRQNKNVITLLRAYEFLIRKRFVRVRLFLTADLGRNIEMERFIEEHGLSHHVMTFPNVSNQKLAALYHCATLVVNPTLYEGGFPFTFGEGMSVGTPSVMSDIPQVREVLEPAGLEDIMFDPYDWRAMADKIEYALQHVDELYERELPLYQKLAKRTPDVMAQDYVKAFEEFMEIDRQRKAAQTAEGACASS